MPSPLSPIRFFYRRLFFWVRPPAKEGEPWTWEIEGQEEGGTEESYHGAWKAARSAVQRLLK